MSGDANNEQMQEEVSRYLQHLTVERQLSSHTLASYTRDLQQLASLLTTQSIQSVTSADIRGCVVRLHAHTLGPRSIARKLSAWRGFFKWLIKRRVIGANPANHVQAPKQKRLLPKALSVEDAVYLAATISPATNDTEAIAHACEHAMYELLYSSGLRISELVALDWRYENSEDYQSNSWIDLDNTEVIVTGKGNKKRSVPIGAAALQALQHWLVLRMHWLKPAGAASQRAALFLSRHGKRISTRLIQLRLQAHAKRIGVQVRVHPHMLRHSFASHVLQSSGDLRAVQEMLGHASIRSTQIYTALDFQRLAQVYDATHPRAKRKNADKNERKKKTPS